MEKLYESTEEGKKVTRNAGKKYLAVFRRIRSNLQDPFAHYRTGSVHKHHSDILH